MRRAVLPLLVALAVGGAALAPAARSDESESPAPASPVERPEDPEAEAPPSPISGEASIEVASRYVYRGFVLEDEGLILRPDLSVEVEVLSGEGPLRALALTLEAWNALHSGDTGLAGDHPFPDAWAEADLYVGAAATFPHEVRLAVQHAWFDAPNGQSAPSAEASLEGSWDDVEDLGREGRGFLGVRPAALLAVETLGQSDEGVHRGVFLGLTLRPTFRLGDGPRAVELSFPTTLGLGLSDYFEREGGGDDLFGFLETGAEAVVPLGGPPDGPSPWSLRVGASVTFLGDALRAWNEEDGPLLVLRAALVFSF